MTGAGDGPHSAENDEVSPVFREAIWRAWRTKVAGDLSSRAGFRDGRYLDFRGSLKLLSSPHLRGGDKGLLREILSGGVWNGFLLSFVKGEIVPCRFCGSPDNDGHLFWECVAFARLERLLGSYSENDCREWVPSDHFLDSVASSDVSDHPDVWTDGSFVLNELSGVGVGGCGMYSLKSGAGWFDRRWGAFGVVGS